jgi:predicted RND superfamily exporter protein
MLEKITKTVTTHPWITIAITLILTCIFFYGLTGIEFLADVKDMLPEGDPTVTAFNEIDETFGGAEYIMLALEAEDIFTHQTLKILEFMTVGIEELEGVSGARSLVNAGEIQGVEYGIEVIELIDEIPVSSKDLEELKARVLEDEDYAGTLVSKDGQVAAIVVQLLSEADTKILLREIEKVINDSGFGGKMHLMGIPVTEDYLSGAVAADMKLLIPIVILVVIVVLFLTLRNLRGVLLPLLMVIISVIWALGLMGFLGIPLTNVSNILPIVLISVGTAYAIHILAHYKEVASSQHPSSVQPSKKIVTKTMSVVGIAILLAGITTMAGFSANSFAPLRPLREFGLFTAFGVGVAFMISMTLIPAVLSLVKIPTKIKPDLSKKKGDGLLNIVLNSLSTATTKSYWLVLSMAAGLVIIAAVALTGLNPEFHLISFYKPDSPPVKSLQLMEEKFGGSAVIQVMVKGDIQDPEVLRSMEQLQSEMEQISGIGRPYSLVNILKDVNEALNEGDTAYRVLPAKSSRQRWKSAKGNN